MPMNLVEGGARRGLFQTRHARLVQLDEPFEFAEPPQPGRPPEKRICWKGRLFQGDGHTVDTNGIWEQSGAFQVQNGVIQRNDLIAVVRLDAEPEAPAQAAQIEAPMSADPEVLSLRAENAQLQTQARELYIENAELRIQLEDALYDPSDVAV
jgi:hypothetical protein